MLTAANTSKISRISSEEVGNKKAKIEEPIRITRITRSRSNETVQAPETLPKSAIRRSPRQSLSGNVSEIKETVKQVTKVTKDEVKSSKKAPAKKAVKEEAVKEDEVIAIKPLSEDPFHVAKRAFHRSGSFKIVGRVEEKAELTSFWYDKVESGKGASIYISGNPGTGKTALVDELITELMGDTKVIKINCMMLKDPLKAFHEISQLIPSLKITDKNPFIILNALEGYFCNDSSDKMTVIIIDEVDQIGMKDPELLCKLLAMPYLENAKVSVIGIANSMDLTERFLPRLKLLNCEPEVLHFPQYTVADITLILCDRLERINSTTSLEGRPFIDKSAIELTARKVASTGDLRRALDMLRQAIDLAEDEYKLSANVNASGALVKLSHVVKIMEKFGSSQSGPLVLLKSLNLHQKVILSAIVGFPQEKGGPVLTIQKLYEEYCAGASRPPKLYDSVTRSEFIDLISNLESMSLIGKSTESSSTSSASSSANLNTDLWKLKVYLLVPNELVKTMISQELPTIKALFGL